jgi:hypothetical protein
MPERRCHSRFVRLWLGLLAASCWAQPSVPRLIERLSEEAAVFAAKAPSLIAKESLRQRALKPPPRFRPRVGEDAKKPLEPKWQERRLESEYTFARFASEAGAIREARQVLSVDGKPVRSSEKALEKLAESLTSSDENRKRLLLKELEKHGLRGAATDFGPLLLLFERSRIDRYEFESRDRRGGTQVFRYGQLEGGEALTVIEGDKAVKLKLSGEVLVRVDDYRLERITLAATHGEGAEACRQEAEVVYTMTTHGVLAPDRILHREWRGGRVVAENEFEYRDWRRFGAASDIKFTPQ